MEKRSPGQLFRPPPAESWNNMVGAGEDYANRLLGTQSTNESSYIPSDLIKLRNDSGGALAQGRVLEIGAKLLTTYTRTSLWFEGDTPAPDGTKGIAITTRQMANNAIDWCQVSGVCLAKVNINHESQTRADVDSSSTLLQSKWHGRAEILNKESTGTGEKLCLIRLGEMFRGPIEVILAATITPGGSGNATVYLNGSSTSSTITAHYKWMEGADDAANGAEAIVYWSPDRQKYMIYELECP